MVELAAKREAAEWLQSEHKDVSQRRAAMLVGIPRSTLRYRPKVSESREERRAMVKQIAGERPRAGYRLITRLLRQRTGTAINHKCVQRLLQEEQLQVRRRRRKKWIARAAPEAEQASSPDQKWAMDFVSDWCTNGRRLKVFTLIDRFTREALAVEADYSFPAQRVVMVLERLRQLGRCPKEIRVDNGPEFVSHRLAAWCQAHQVTLSFIERGKPIQNAQAESFNGRLREECLSIHYFRHAIDAKIKIGQWWRDYNLQRPHGSLNGRTPSAFAQLHGARPLSFASEIVSAANPRRRQGHPTGSLRSALTAAPGCLQHNLERGEGRIAGQRF